MAMFLAILPLNSTPPRRTHCYPLSCILTEYFDCLQSVRPTPQNEAITVYFKPVTLKASESKYTKVASISFDGKYCSSLLRTCLVLLKTYWTFIDYFHCLNKTLFIILRRKWDFPTWNRLTVLLNFSYFWNDCHCSWSTSILDW